MGVWHASSQEGSRTLLCSTFWYSCSFPTVPKIPTSIHVFQQWQMKVYFGIPILKKTIINPGGDWHLGVEGISKQSPKVLKCFKLDHWLLWETIQIHAGKYRTSSQCHELRWHLRCFMCTNNYNPCKWPYKWVSVVIITLLIGAITPFIPSRGPTLWDLQQQYAFHYAF